MQGKGLYPRARDIHNVRGYSILFREDATPLQVEMDDLMLVTKPDLCVIYEGAHLTRGQVGAAVEQLKTEWRKWNRHVNAVLVTSYSEEADESVVLIGILYPNRYRNLVKSYVVLNYADDSVYEPAYYTYEEDH
jgi:hypothetical protein